MTHYIGMAGLHGCLPNYCQGFASYDIAVGALAQMYELGHKRTRQLWLSPYVELDPGRDGNEYAEIETCDCPEPWVHSEDDGPEDWRESET